MTIELPPQPCAGCTMCCVLLGVKEIEKLPNRMCQHCEPGVGCKVYAERPTACQEFECAYALGMLGEGEDARPDNSYVVFSFTTDGQYPVAYVHPHRSDAWKKGPAGRWFKLMVDKLGRGVVVIGNKRMAVGSDAARMTAVAAEEWLRGDVPSDPKCS